MTLAEAQSRLDNILKNNGASLVEIEQFIIDLLADTEIAPSQKYHLLERTSGEQKFNIGMMIIRLRGYYGEDQIERQKSTFKKYITLLQQIGSSVNILSLLTHKVHIESFYPTDFARLYHFVACFRDSEVIQYFLQLLIEVGKNPDNIATVLRQLNEPRTQNQFSTGLRNFYEEIETSQTSVDLSILSEIIKSQLSRALQLEDMLKNPEDFISKLIPVRQLVSHLLHLLPDRFYDSTLKALATACTLSGHLAEDNCTHFTDSSYMKIDNTKSITELLLTSVCFHKLKCKKMSAPGHIIFMQDMLDENIVPVLALLFKGANTIEFKGCKMSQPFLQLYEQARARVGTDYQPKTIILDAIEMDKMIFDQQTGTCLTSAFVFAASTVNTLIIRNTTMVSALFKCDAYLKFLASMPHLTTLALENVQFRTSHGVHSDPAGRDTLRLVILQSLERAELTSLTLNFPLLDEDLFNIVTVIRYNLTLRYLKLAKGRFEHATLMELAGVLRTSKRNLIVDLDPTIVMPQLLIDAIKDNKQRSQLPELYDEVQNYIKNIPTLLASTNPATREANQNSPPHASPDIVFDPWKRIWAKMEKACDNVRTILAYNYPTAADAMKLCESLIKSGSSLLFPSIAHIFQNKSLLSIGVDELISLSSNLTHPKAHTEFVHDLYKFCSGYLQYLIDSYGIPPSLIREKSGHSSNASKSSSTLKQYNYYHDHTEYLIKILLHIPADPTFFYQEVNTMLFTLLGCKILASLDKKNYTKKNHSENNDPGVSDPQMRDLATNIKNSNTIADLHKHLNNYLETVPMVRTAFTHVMNVSLQAIAVLDKLDPNAGIVPRPDPCGAIINNLKTDMINALRSIRSEIDKILIARQLHHQTNVQLPSRPTAYMGKKVIPFTSTDNIGINNSETSPLLDSDTTTDNSAAAQLLPPDATHYSLEAAAAISQDPAAANSRNAAGLTATASDRETSALMRQMSALNSPVMLPPPSSTTSKSSASSSITGRHVIDERNGQGSVILSDDGSAAKSLRLEPG